MPKIQKYIEEHPECASMIPILLGLILIIGVVRDWDWLLEGDGRVFNMAWFSNQWGRKAARIVMGIFGGVLILLGVGWYFLFR